MEVIRTRSEGSREISSSSSPDRVKIFVQPKVKPIKKVQIVYYLARNGHLEHPHYIEVTHLANQPLRLKDVIDRLIDLRGKGMPSLYSWSCKRSYKNGYVWNDLAENDARYRADGVEFVLKGSELVENCSEKFQQLSVSRGYNLSSKRKLVTPNLHKEPEGSEKTTYEQEYDQEEEEEHCEDEEKTSYTSSTTPHSRCSRGVSTDELKEQEPQNKCQTDQTTSPLLFREKPKQISSSNNNNKSKKFEDDVAPVAADSAPSRDSVLLQLISCGNLAVSKAKNVSSLKQPAGKKGSGNGGLHRGVLCKSAVKVAEEEDVITFMPENPRFGNFQSVEKEYFSGSIVESASKEQVEIQPVLKKSNSYNEERSRKAGLGEAILEAEEAEKRRNFAVKGKCIPRKKSSSSSSSKKIRT